MARRTLDDILAQAWWGKFLLGAFNLFLVYCVWGRYYSLKPGESFEVVSWAPLIWLYELFGIWGLLLPWGLIGIGLTYWGLSQLFKQLTGRQQAAAAAPIDGATGPLQTESESADLPK